jgi:hypothetical protein
MNPWERYWAVPHAPTGVAKLALNTMYGRIAQSMELKGEHSVYPIHHARRVSENKTDGTIIVGPDQLTIISEIRDGIGAVVGYLAVKESDPINGAVERLDGDTVNVLFIQRYTVAF